MHDKQGSVAPACEEHYRDVLSHIIEGYDIEPRYTVKELAELIDTSEHTIRFYDKEGLFPFVMRDKNNRRLFSKLDAFLGRSTNCFRGVGFSLDECRHMNVLNLKGDITIPERAEMLRKKYQETLDQIAELEIRLKKLKHKSEFFESYEKEILDELANGTFQEKGRSTLRNCHLFAHKKFLEAGLIDPEDVEKF